MEPNRTETDRAMNGEGENCCFYIRTINVVLSQPNSYTDANQTPINEPINAFTGQSILVAVSNDTKKALRAIPFGGYGTLFEPQPKFGHSCGIVTKQRGTTPLFVSTQNV